MKLILTFSGVLIFVPGCHWWSHTAHAVRINIAYPKVLLFYQARDRSHLPSVKESLLSLHSLSASGSSLRWDITYYTAFRDAILQASLHWHSAEPIWLMLCQKRLLPHSTSLPPGSRLAISAFRSLQWCNPLIPLSSLLEPAAISIGTALSQ